MISSLCYIQTSTMQKKHYLQDFGIYLCPYFKFHSLFNKRRSKVEKGLGEGEGCSTTFINAYLIWFAIRLIYKFLKSISNCSIFFLLLKYQSKHTHYIFHVKCRYICHVMSNNICNKRDIYAFKSYILVLPNYQRLNLYIHTYIHIYIYI